MSGLRSIAPQFATIIISWLVQTKGRQILTLTFEANFEIATRRGMAQYRGITFDI